METAGERSLEKDIETVLNLITKLQKENEEKDRQIKTLNHTNKTYKGMLNKQSKQIDLMAEFISKYHCFEVTVYDLDDECTHEHECKDCIKKYFETKAKKGE